MSNLFGILVGIIEGCCGNGNYHVVDPLLVYAAALFADHHFTKNSSVIIRRILKKKMRFIDFSAQ
jgi:hypothetical protein